MMAACKPRTAVLLDNPYLRAEDGDHMEFRLIYGGPLLSSSKRSKERRDRGAAHKHEIRKVFHQQLKQLWEAEPFLRDSPPMMGGIHTDHKTWKDYLASEYTRNGYRFVPLVVERLFLACSVHILYLRRGYPGDILTTSGDIDNKTKTIFDALQVPTNASELGGYDTPDEGEDPFFCLVENDKQITHLSVETDRLLVPDTDTVNDAAIIVTVKVRPYRNTLENNLFL